jgi:hypothetical protein
VSVEQGNGGSIAAEQAGADELSAPGSASVTRFVAPPRPETVTNGEYETVAHAPCEALSEVERLSILGVP